jgi:hypothetical protein
MDDCHRVIVMRTLLAAAIATAILASPGHAQFDTKSGKDPLELKYEQEKRDREDIDKSYADTVRRTRSNAPAAKRDPWATVRPSDSGSTKR